MARKKTRAEKAHEGKTAGQPTKYKAEYCEMLEAHMSEGGSFYSFGAVVKVDEKTLFNWTETYEEFFQSKSNGELLSLKWHEDLAKGLMTGTLRRVKKEFYKKDSKGDIVLGPDGRPVVESREYTPTRGDSRVYGINMRAQFRKFGYANKIELTGRGGGPIRTKDVSDLTDEELEKELEDLDKQGV